MIDRYFIAASRATIAVCILLTTSLVTCAESEDEDLVYAIYEAAMTNNLAIDKYDVIIREELLETARKKEDEAIFTPTVYSRITRIVMDRANQKFLRVVRVYGESDGKKTFQHYKTVNKVNPEYWIDFFENGKCIRRMSGFNNKSLWVWKTDFYGFCRSADIPFIEMCTWCELHSIYGKPLEEFVELSAWNKKNASVRILGDGTVMLTYNSTKVAGFISTKILDVTSKMPLTMSMYDNRTGEHELLYRSDLELEEVNGIHRVKTIRHDKMVIGPPYSMLTDRYKSDARKSNTGIQMTAIGTTNVEWLQFNEEHLKFPEMEDFGSDRTKWQKFLKLRPEEIAKDAEFSGTAK